MAAPVVMAIPVVPTARRPAMAIRWLDWNVISQFERQQTAFRDARIAELITEDPCVLPRGKLKRLGKVVRLPYGWPALLALTGDLVQPARRIWNALAFYTGMREGEVCGRRWRDWDRNAEPLSSLSITTQYDDQPLKTEVTTERPRKAPVHPRLAELLAWWWSEGFEFVYLRPPTTDDFIVPNRRMGMGNHTKSSAYKAWRKSTEEAGVTNLSLHSARHTFITLARRGGADKFLVEKITHNAKGDIVDQYTHAEWAPLCQVVLCIVPPVDASAPRAADRATGEKSSQIKVEAPGIELGRWVLRGTARNAAKCYERAENKMVRDFRRRGSSPLGSTGLRPVCGGIRSAPGKSPGAESACLVGQGRN